MSADSLLTTLCSVCRARPPRYKCPQCTSRYCSVPCNRRHRTRTGCSGIRDVTAFVPKAKLCTESGIDRDYNFLQRIETARFSTHKHVVDERRVLRPSDVTAYVLGEDEPAAQRSGSGSVQQRGKFGPNSSNNKRGAGGQHRKPQEPAPNLQKQWQGEELRYVPTRPRMVPRLAAGDGRDAAAVCALAEPAAATTAVTATAMTTPYEATAASQRVRALCRRHGITLLGAPRGLARQRANSTTVWTDRPAGSTTAGAAATGVNGSKPPGEVLLHWQVEWLLYGPTEMQRGGTSSSSSSSSSSKPAPVLRQLLDNVPLFRAYVSVVNWRRQQQRSGAAGKLIVEEDPMDTRGDNDDEDIATTTTTTTTRRPPPVQSSAPYNSFFFAHDVQNPYTGAWHTVVADRDSDARLDTAHLAAKYNLRYYLLRPRVPGMAPSSAGKDKGKGPVNELIPLDATDTLASALPGRSVLEFPTIYVLPAGASDDLPAGCVLGSTARSKVITEVAAPKNGIKRPWEGSRGNPATKRREPLAGNDDESETSSSGSDSSEEEEEEEEEDDEESEAEEEEDVEDEDGELMDATPAAAASGIGIKGLPPLPGSDVGADGGRRKLVVYDSWSEGSDSE